MFDQEFVEYPSPETAFICNDQLKMNSPLNPFLWYDEQAVAGGILRGAQIPQTAAEVTDWASFYTLISYYDFTRANYINYFRTFDLRHRVIARRAADVWIASQWIDRGTVRSGPNCPTMRTSSMGGLMLRALDGRPELWDFIFDRVSAEHLNWVVRRIDDDILYYDIREDGFAQLYAVMCAKCLPDEFDLFADGIDRPPTGKLTDGRERRAKFLDDAERAAVKFFGRLQKPDGSWRFNVYTSDPRDNLINIEQPFMSGMYLQAAILLYRLTQKQDVKDSLAEQITRSCKHLYNDTFQRSPVTDRAGVSWRAIDYFWGGGTVADPTLYEEGRSQPWGATGYPDDTSQRNVIRGARHLNATIIDAFGVAYLLTNDELYRQMGDDIADACYGTARDDVRGLMDEKIGHPKLWTMNMMTASSYFAHRMQGGITDPQVTFPPDVSIPPPLPVPVAYSIVCTPFKLLVGEQLFVNYQAPRAASDDSMLGLYPADNRTGESTKALIETRLGEFHTGRHAIPFHYSAGEYVVRLTTPSGEVVATSNRFTAQDYQIQPPPVESPPAPPPPPPAIRQVGWPALESAQDKILAAQWAEGFRLKRNLAGRKAEFERVGNG